MKQFPSIFNDVIGPIVAGSSSSHTVAAVRLGWLLKQAVGGKVVEFRASFDAKGPLGSSYHTLGCDVGLCAGILGLRYDDERLRDSVAICERERIKVSFETKRYDDFFPHTFHVYARGLRKAEVTAIATGGGMIKIVVFNGVPVAIDGSFYEYIIETEKPAYYRRTFFGYNFGVVHVFEKPGYVQIESAGPIPLEMFLKGDRVVSLTPFLEVEGQPITHAPFRRAFSMLRYGRLKGNLSLSELSTRYESMRGFFDNDQIISKMADRVSESRTAIGVGLGEKTYYERFKELRTRLSDMSQPFETPIGQGLSERITSYISALIELKGGGGITVANPGGLSGCVSAVVLAAIDELNLPEEAASSAMLAAGIVGVLIMDGVTFAMDAGGCQAFCLFGSAMAAAALCQIFDFSPDVCMNAAATALLEAKELISCESGCVVDCLERNIKSGFIALKALYKAAAYEEIISFDEALIETNKYGNELPLNKRCEGIGWLSPMKHYNRTRRRRKSRSVESQTIPEAKEE